MTFFGCPGCVPVVKEKSSNLLIFNPLDDCSGERGIRTPGPVKINSFQDCRIRPLCHLSNMFPILGFAPIVAFPEWDCKGTNKFQTCKFLLNFLFFFV